MGLYGCGLDELIQQTDVETAQGIGVYAQVLLQPGCKFFHAAENETWGDGHQVTQRFLGRCHQVLHPAVALRLDAESEIGVVAAVIDEPSLGCVEAATTLQTH